MKSTMDIYLFMGAPGSGKGSLAQLCVQELGWKQLSTGNLCRKHISEGTKIGKEIDFFIKSGKLVPDELVTAMVVEWLDQEANDTTPIILDGFPRTRVQAEALDKELGKSERWNLKIINLVIDDEAVVKRLSHRFICKNKECQAIYSLDPDCILLGDNGIVCEVCQEKLCRRKDDKPEAIRERLAIYHKHEDSLLQYYRDKGYRIVDLEAQQPLPETFEDFKRIAGSDTAS